MTPAYHLPASFEFDLGRCGTGKSGVTSCLVSASVFMTGECLSLRSVVWALTTILVARLLLRIRHAEIQHAAGKMGSLLPLRTGNGRDREVSAVWFELQPHSS